MSNVTDFPKPPELPDLLVGPFEHYKVVVDGRSIPRLSGHPLADGSIALVVDDRFEAIFPADLARQAAWLIAQAMAVSEGYPHMGATEKTRPFAPRCGQLGEIPQ